MASGGIIGLTAAASHPRTWLLCIAIAGLLGCSKKEQSSPEPMSQEQITEEQVRAVASEIAQARRDFDGPRFGAQLSAEAQVRYLEPDGRPTDITKPQFTEYLQSLQGKAKSSKYEMSDTRVRTEGSRATYEAVVEEVLTFEGMETFQRSKHTWQLEMRDGKPLIIDMFIEIAETRFL